jgi:hypothetical protein
VTSTVRAMLITAFHSSFSLSILCVYILVSG